MFNLFKFKFNIFITFKIIVLLFNKAYYNARIHPKPIFFIFKKYDLGCLAKKYNLSAYVSCFHHLIAR